MKNCSNQMMNIGHLLNKWGLHYSFFPLSICSLIDWWACSKACDYMVRNGDHTHWGPICRRDLLANEEGDLFSLLELLSWFSYVGGGPDSRVWVPSRDEAFSAASFYLGLSHDNLSRSPLSSLWKLKIPPRSIFGWVVGHLGKHPYNGQSSSS